MIKELATVCIAKTYRAFDGTSGTYVSVTPDLKSEETIASWLSVLGLPIDKKRISELHCTVVWSKTAVTDPSCESAKFYTAQLNHFEYWDGHDGDGYIVALLDSQDLQSLHNKWVDRGAVHSFPDYSAHVTLLSKIRPSAELYQKMVYHSSRLKGQPIRFTNEQIENVKS